MLNVSGVFSVYFLYASIVGFKIVILCLWEVAFLFGSPQLK